MNRNPITNQINEDWSIETADQKLGTIDWNNTTMDRTLSESLYWLSQDWISLGWRIRYVLMIIQLGYYPILAIVALPVNSITIGILMLKKSGLSNCVTHYLVAMAVADLMVAILDLILRQIPIAYADQFLFLLSFLPVCNIHAVLLYAATDCSVWFTVTFTIDRFVAICCMKLKNKYCTEKVADIVLGTVTMLSLLKNVFWYFMLTGQYWLGNVPWFCYSSLDVYYSVFWGTIEFVHHILNPCLPFVFILLLNIFTIRHILLSSRARKRLRTGSSGESHVDPELKSRRKSIMLLFLISANFILLWSMLMVFSISYRMWFLGFQFVYLEWFVQDLGLMLQLLSCCTNTAIYAMTQTRFREQMKIVLKYPFTHIIKLVQQ